MTYSKEVTFWCDAEGCHEWSQLNYADALGLVTEARKILRRRGWRRQGSHDICPDHPKGMVRCQD